LSEASENKEGFLFPALKALIVLSLIISLSPYTAIIGLPVYIISSIVAAFSRKANAISKLKWIFIPPGIYFLLMWILYDLLQRH
jgi:hypothetical protein